MDLALSFPVVFGDIALSRAVTQSTSCTAPAVNGTGEPRSPTQACAMPAWARGCSASVSVAMQSSASSPSRIPAVARADGGRPRARSPERLGVPAPSVFRPGADRQRQHRVRRVRRAGRRRNGASARRDACRRKRASCSSSARCGATRKWFARHSLESAPSSRWKSVITRCARTCRSRSGVRCCSALPANAKAEDVIAADDDADQWRDDVPG